MIRTTQHSTKKVKQPILKLLLIGCLITIASMTGQAVVAGNFFAADGYEAKWVSQTQAGTPDAYFDVEPCEVVDFTAKFRNTGSRTWKGTGDEQVAFNIYKDPAVISYPAYFSYRAGDRESYFEHSGWLTPFRVVSISERQVAPGNTGTVSMKYQVPCDAKVGVYREDISMAVGPLWMPNPTNGDPLGVAHIWAGFVIGKKNKTMKTNPSGLRIIEDKSGAGDAIAQGDRVTVHYSFKLGDGTEFDNTHYKGQPFTFSYNVGNVIAGLDEGVKGMRVGGERTLIIPPELAYGSRGAGDKVPPYAYLIAEVELIAIEENDQETFTNGDDLCSGKFCSYSNELYVLDYPAEWMRSDREDREDGSFSVYFFPPMKGAADQEYENVFLGFMETDVMSETEFIGGFSYYKEAVRDGMKENGAENVKQESSKQLTVDGNTALSLVMSGDSHGMRIKQHHVVVYHKAKVYIAIYTSPIETYDDYLDEFNALIQSISFT